MTPTQALMAIQTMTDHSQKWRDETLSQSFSSSSNTDGLAAIVSKMDNLGRDMKKLKENVEEAKYGEFGRPTPFNRNNEAKYHIEVQESYEEIAYKISLIAQETNMELRENEIFETIIKKLHDEWFKGTDEDDEDLEGIIDFLEPTLYDEFIDSGDEEYKERKCRMLEMPYIKPPPIIIEKVNVTRYSIGPGEVYRKIKISGVEELSMTRGNIATIRAEIMNEFLKNDDKKESYDAT
nr:hypothetical protein [Tanacetum cinerariifolium]